MELRIEDVKPGAKIYAGRYAISAYEPQPILWLKANNGLQIISDKVLDHIVYDQAERTNRDAPAFYYGTVDYLLSNIHQYMNSDEYDWFEKTHHDDEAPFYRRHPGFLYYFADYEIKSIQSVDLPEHENLFVKDSDKYFQLFKKHGIRPHLTEDLLSHANLGIRETGYSGFWMQNVSPRNNGCVEYVMRDGYVSHQYPSSSGGLRPVITLAAGTKMHVNDDGTLSIAEFEVEESIAFSEDELMSFLGLR